MPKGRKTRKAATDGLRGQIQTIITKVRNSLLGTDDEYDPAAQEPRAWNKLTLGQREYLGHQHLLHMISQGYKRPSLSETARLAHLSLQNLLDFELDEGYPSDPRNGSGYKPRSELTLQQRLANIAALKAEAETKRAHADALQAETDALVKAKFFDKDGNPKLDMLNGNGKPPPDRNPPDLHPI